MMSSPAENTFGRLWMEYVQAHTQRVWKNTANQAYFRLHDANSNKKYDECIFTYKLLSTVTYSMNVQVLQEPAYVHA